MNFTMYSTPWCGYCYRLKGQLTQFEIACVSLPDVFYAFGVAAFELSGVPVP